MDLDRLNSLPVERARQAFLDCCASGTWASRMTKRRPFADPEDLFEASRAEWRDLDRADRDRAFAAHTRIGETAPGHDRHSVWSRREQAGTGDVPREVRDRLADCNRRYEERFGRVYLVFATARSAVEMLAMCEERLENDPETEFWIASAEQEKITDLRLRRLIGIG